MTAPNKIVGMAPDITGLTLKVAPEATDEVLLWDSVSAVFQKALATALGHAPASVAAAPLTLSGQAITFNYDTNDFQLSVNNLQVKDSGIAHDSTSGVHQNVNTAAEPTFAALKVGGASELFFGPKLDVDGGASSYTGIFRSNADARFYLLSNQLDTGSSDSFVVMGNGKASDGTGMWSWYFGTDDSASDVFVIGYKSDGLGSPGDADILTLSTAGGLTNTGAIRSNAGFNVNGSAGVSSTLTLDDGANWRITMTFTGGILTAKTTAASSGQAATWS